MITLGHTVTVSDPPSAEFWLESADSLQDPAVFLVRYGGSPLFGRVCMRGDLTNWPDEDSASASFGWYRAAGLRIPLEDSGQLSDLFRSLEAELNRLDASMALEPEESTGSADLRYGRTGSVFGTLDWAVKEYDGQVRVEFTVSISDSALDGVVPSGLFVISGGELLRVACLADLDEDASPGSGESLESGIAVWLDPELFSDVSGALGADLEDIVTYLAVREGLDVLGSSAS